MNSEPDTSQYGGELYLFYFRFYGTLGIFLRLGINNICSFMWQSDLDILHLHVRQYVAAIYCHRQPSSHDPMNSSNFHCSLPQILQPS